MSNKLNNQYPSLNLCGQEVGLGHKLFLIAGPCVIETEDLTLRTAERLKKIAEKLGILLIYKSSFDKANRSSSQSFRGPGIDEGLRILEKVQRDVGLPVLTDVHTASQVQTVAEVVDVLQTPAFLVRQTDLIEAAAASGRPVNIKKGQFLAPGDMANVVAKARVAAAEVGIASPSIMVAERGACFGYNNLVSDMRGLVIMRETNCPLVFDATHSVQLPGGLGNKSSGERQFVSVLARAAVSVGIAGLFLETHPDPANALSDGPNTVPLDHLEPLLTNLVDLDSFVKERRLIDQ